MFKFNKNPGISFGQHTFTTQSADEQTHRTE